VAIRLAAGGERVRYGIRGRASDPLTVAWTVNASGAAVTSPGVTPIGADRRVPIDGPTEVALSVTYTQFGGATVTYRQEVLVVPTGTEATVVWPPETRVCRLTPDCGYEGTYVGDRGSYLTGVSVNESIETVP
jgi:hypothetical protein